jgi:hypothetical protein
MATAFPETARKISEAGHTIGTHSQNHPFRLNRLPLDKIGEEVDEGIASVRSALGDPKALAPFFRIPGLARNEDIDNELYARSLVTFSADFVADDWFHHIKPGAIVERAMSRLEARGKGILLLHDIHPATAAALPELLRQLKEKGYRIVHVVPVSPDRPKTVTAPQDWLRNAGRVTWPRVVAHVTPHRDVLPAPSEQLFANIGHPFGAKAIIRIFADAKPAAGDLSDPHWPQSAAIQLPSPAPQLPAPSLEDIGIAMDGRDVVGEPFRLRPSVEIIQTTPQPKAKPLKDTRAEAEPIDGQRTGTSTR